MLPNESTDPIDAGRFALVARFVHISDAQIIDEESPGRLTALSSLNASAWRPHEAYSTQLLDGTIRAVNRMHATELPIDFLLHTGDATDNAQHNELEWFIAAFDGVRIDPRTGPDDRREEDRPDPLLDPHSPFQPQGLYRHGIHGPEPTIPWYAVLGNHDHFALGVFPIVTDLLGRRTGPLPLSDRIGIFLPRSLDPAGTLSWAPVSPAHPGPPPELNLPRTVSSNSDRRFITDGEFVAAHWRSISEPQGHGFRSSSGPTWYSVAPVPGLRLIGLNSAAPALEVPAQVYSEGAISAAQVRYLKEELGKACRRDETVIVATHHPGSTLDVTAGTALTEATLVKLLNNFPCVKLHLAGHLHGNLAIDRGGYVEIVTSSVLDAPQQGRVIEIWRAAATTELRYWLFSHLEVIEPARGEDAALFEDPLLPMRRAAAELAGAP